MYELTSVYVEDYSKELLIDLFTKYNFIFYMIIHDKDLKDNLDLKKAHYHIAIQSKSDNPKRDMINIVNELLNIKETNVSFQPIKKAKPFLRYLLHLDNPEKYQYQLSDIISNDLENYKELIKIEIKISTTDIILDDFIKFINNNLDNGVVITDIEIYSYFKNKHKLDYWLKNVKGLNSLLSYEIMLRSR